MEVVVLAVTLAVVIEAIIEYVKDLLTSNFVVEKVIALLVGLVLAFGARLDLFEMLKIDFGIPYVGLIIMGIFISKGSGWVHDLFDKLLQNKI